MGRTRGTTSPCNLKRVCHSVGAIGTDPCVVVSAFSFCSRSHSLSLSLFLSPFLWFPKDDVDPSSQMSPNTGGAYGKSSLAFRLQHSAPSGGPWWQWRGSHALARAAAVVLSCFFHVASW